MSYAMDDYSLTNSFDVSSKTKLIRESQAVETEKKVEIPVNSEKISEFDDEFELKELNVDISSDEIIKAQEVSSKIDILGNSLSEIKSYIGDIKSEIKENKPSEVSTTEINNILNKIEKSVQDTNFNGENLISDSLMNELKLEKLKNPKLDDKQQLETYNKQLSQINDKIEEKEKTIADNKAAIEKTISGVVELKIPPTDNMVDIEIKETPIEKLKKSTIDSIKADPEKSKVLHIRHLDGKLLLAMLSLRTST